MSALQKGGLDANDFTAIIAEVKKLKSTDKRKIQSTFRKVTRERLATKLGGNQKGLEQLREITDKMADSNSKGHLFEAWSKKHLKGEGGGRSRHILLNDIDIVPDNIKIKGDKISITEYKNTDRGSLDSQDLRKIPEYSDYLSDASKKVKIDGKPYEVKEVTYIYSTKAEYDLMQGKISKIPGGNKIKVKYIDFDSNGKPNLAP